MASAAFDLRYNKPLQVTAVTTTANDSRKQQPARASIAHRDPMLITQQATLRSLPHRDPISLSNICPAELSHREPMSISQIQPQIQQQSEAISLNHRDFMSIQPPQQVQFKALSLNHRDFMNIEQQNQIPQPAAACLNPRDFMTIPSTMGSQMTQMAQPQLNQRDFMTIQPPSQPINMGMMQMAQPCLNPRDFMTIPSEMTIPQPLIPAEIVETPNLLSQQQQQSDNEISDEFFHERMSYYSDQQALIDKLNEANSSSSSSSLMMDVSPTFVPERREEFFINQEDLLNTLPSLSGAIMPSTPSLDLQNSMKLKRRKMLNTNTASSSESNTSNERNVRVFISSTFRDMGEERELLLKRIMPQLKEFASKRGVDITEVDLRWGISEEQSQNGSTIQICLEEIDRCRPYFICMLGERYGWSQLSSPNAKHDELLSKTFTHAEPLFPWIKNYTDRSVTELEVRYGVLNGGKKPNADPLHTLFLLRNPNFASGKGSNFVSESPAAAARLADLKQQIKRSNGSISTVHDYNTPTEAANDILAHLKQAISRDFPEEITPSALEQERIIHSIFARNKSRVFIGQEPLLHTMLSHFSAQDSKEHPIPIMISGNLGSGCSSLLATFSKRLKESQPELPIIEHFIGCTASSKSLPNALRRIAEEIVDIFDLPNSSELLPNDNANAVKIAECLPKLLNEASIRGGLVIVVDALDSLDPSDGSHELLWIPNQLPAKVQLVFSCASNTNCYQSMLKYQGEKRLLTISPLDESSKRKIVTTVMSRHGKSLSETQITQLISTEASGLPFWLRTALEELRVFGSFEELSTRINQITKCLDPSSLLSLVLSRIEADQKEADSNNTNSVATLLGLLCVCKRGIREDEATIVLNISGMSWASLRLSLSDFLDMHNGGLLTFSHGFIQQAATNRYLKNNISAQSNYRQMFINYFKSSSNDIQRSCEELPELLLQEKRTEELSEYISKPNVFSILCTPKHRFDLIKFTRFCQTNGRPIESRLVESFKQQQQQQQGNNNEIQLNELTTAGKFFADIASYPSAEAVYKLAIQIAENNRNNNSSEAQIAAIRDSLGYLYRLQARFEEATPHYIAALESREKAFGKESIEVASTSIGLAILYRKRGKYDLAEPLYLRSCELREKLLGHNHPETAQSHNGLGCLYQDQGKDSLSEKHFRMALSIRERCLGPDHPDVAMTLNNLGTLLMTQARYEEAESLCSRALKIYHAVYGDFHPDVANALSYLASVLVEKGQYAKARPLYQQAISVRVKLLGELHPEVADSVTDFGVLCARERNYDEALLNYQRALKIRQTVLGEEHPDTAQSYNNVAAILSDRGDHETAEQMYNKALQITEKKFGSEHVNVVQSLLKLANLYQRQGRSFGDIIALYIRSLAILTKCYGEIHPDIALTINDMAVLSFREGKLDEAEGLYKRMIDIHTKLFNGKDHPEVARSFENVALFYRAIGKEADALNYERKAREMRSRIGSS